MSLAFQVAHGKAMCEHSGQPPPANLCPKTHPHILLITLYPSLPKSYGPSQASSLSPALSRTDLGWAALVVSSSFVKQQ